MEEQITFFAETNFRGQKQRFGIKARDRRMHTYIIGRSGMGKTTLLENMAIQDIQNNHGLAIVDPHGEFAEKMLDFIPEERVKDVVYFNPSDLDYPIAFNVMEKVEPEYRYLIASGLMGVFKKIWPDVWSARMEYILNNTILALLEYPEATLLGINRMLADKDYRQKVVEHLTDPTIKSFWQNEFAKYPERFREEAVAPIQNKVGQFISSPLIRNVIGQNESSINIREIMDTGKILILNLSKGRIGEDASRLLGALFITKLQLAAMSRVDLPENERRDFYLYVDEFQNFATESFSSILSEARKYRLNLTLAHQYITQMEEEVRDAVFGNIGTLIVFRVGGADAEFLEKEFEPEFILNDLVDLGFAHIYLKLMINGAVSRPFSALTLSPLSPLKIGYREEAIRYSQERYGTPKQKVEERIAKWSGVMTDEKEKTGFIERDDEIKKIETICWNCGKKIKVPFQPDGVRPVYCLDCLKRPKEMRRPAQAKDAPPNASGIIQNEDKIVNLEDAFKRGPVDFKSRKKKEIDVNGLKKTLEGVLEENSGDEQNKLGENKN